MRTLLTLLCCVALNAQAETFDAKVIMVMDGDTVMVLKGKQKIKVRMVHIDAPEKDQAFGKQSRESLQEMVGKKTVRIDSQAVDQYGRVIGMISVDGVNVNQEQIKRGMAWENTHFHSDKRYLAMQAEAQQSRHGLWAQTDPEAPWSWRKLHHSGNASPQHKQADTAVSGDAACGKKRYCSQMATCDEAHLYLTQCGVTTLDRNKDGVPCESLCVDKK
ncbi:MAG: thermonuclease family protein [Gallionella sp.]|nr:thermonuclease family protein [Gallionella sp.]